MSEVVTERKELLEKANKLGVFLSTEIFRCLPQAEQSLLCTQSKQMIGYLDTLDRRIALFDNA